MPKNILEERLRWVLPITNKEKKLRDVLKVFPYSERTLKRWLQAYRKGKEKALMPRSTAPKTQPNETPIRIKEEITSNACHATPQSVGHGGVLGEWQRRK